MYYNVLNVMNVVKETLRSLRYSPKVSKIFEIWPQKSSLGASLYPIAFGLPATVPILVCRRPAGTGATEEISNLTRPQTIALRHEISRKGEGLKDGFAIPT